MIAQKNKQREAVIKMLRLLGRYVEVTSDGDITHLYIQRIRGGFDDQDSAGAVASTGHQKRRSRRHYGRNRCSGRGYS